ncbi:hypothetical protein PG984_005153 [Apiospora sp. TS-2023a]
MAAFGFPFIGRIRKSQSGSDPENQDGIELEQPKPFDLGPLFSELQAYQRTQRTISAHNSRDGIETGTSEGATGNTETTEGTTTGTDHDETSRPNLKDEWDSFMAARLKTHREKLLEILDPMIQSECSTLLMCWNDMEQFHIMPAYMKHSAPDAITHWQEARRTWYRNRGYWRLWMPCYGVKSMRVVKVRYTKKQFKTRYRLTRSLDRNRRQDGADRAQISPRLGLGGHSHDGLVL